MKSPDMIPPILSAIVARSRNGVIGRDGDLPWRLSSDLKHFKKITLGKPCVMGRKTWDSLPGVLPGRPHLVLTRDKSFEAKGAEVFHDISSVIGRGAELCGALGQSELMIIGGAQLYQVMMPHLDRIYETEVQAEIEGDAFFPALNKTQWHLADEAAHKAGPKDDFDFVTRQFDRAHLASAP